MQKLVWGAFWRRSLLQAPEVAHMSTDHADQSVQVSTGVAGPTEVPIYLGTWVGQQANVDR